MIAFCRFEFTELTEFQEATNKIKLYKDQCEVIKKESDELQAKTFLINSESNQLRPIVEKCRARSENLKDKLQAIKEARKKLKDERETLALQEASLEAEEKETTSRQEAISKKFSLYSKLIVRSPQRLNNEMEKNEARVAELEKLIIQINKENDEEKRNLFEREKFIDSSEKICEILQNLHDNHVNIATMKSKEIEAINEEITNLNFELEQIISVNESLKAELQKSESNVSKYRLDCENEKIQLREKIDKNKEAICNICKELDDLQARKEDLNRDINERNRETKISTDKGIETVSYYQKTEEIYKQAVISNLIKYFCYQ